jgi:Leucine-rich repeat (LRR) protein
MKTKQRLLVTLLMAMFMGVEIMAETIYIPLDLHFYVAGKKAAFRGDGGSGYYKNEEEFFNDLSLGGGTVELDYDYSEDTQNGSSKSGWVLKLTNVTINDPKAIYIEDDYSSDFLTIELYGNNHIYSSGQPITSKSSKNTTIKVMSGHTTIESTYSDAIYLESARCYLETAPDAVLTIRAVDAAIKGNGNDNCKLYFNGGNFSIWGKKGDLVSLDYVGDDSFGTDLVIDLYSTNYTVNGIDIPLPIVNNVRAIGFTTIEYANYYTYDGTLVKSTAFMDPKVRFDKDKKQLVDDVGIVNYEVELRNDYAAIVNKQFFPDANLRRYIKDEFGDVIYRVQVEETDELNVEDLEIADLTGIEYFTELTSLNFDGNYGIAAVDVSNNKKLTSISCYKNQLRGTNMDNFVRSLPIVTGGELYVYDCENLSYPDGNEMTPRQVAAAKKKGWEVYVYDNHSIDGSTHTHWSTTDGYYLINKDRFPDSQFRRVLNDMDFRCYGALTQEDINETQEMMADSYSIMDMAGIEYFTELEVLDITCNMFVNNGIELSQNKRLKNLYIQCNNISGSDMDHFVANLPSVTGGEIWVYDGRGNWPETNEMTAKQVTAAKQKGWTVKVYDEKDTGNWVETNGFWRFSAERFPDAYFRNWLIANKSWPSKGAIRVESAEATKNIQCPGKSISSLKGLEYFPNIEELVCYGNNIEEIDLSDFEKLYYVDCSMNKINGSAMNKMIASLRTMPEGKQGTLRVINRHNSNYTEGNEMSINQVAAAKAKRWIPYEYNGSKWVEYTGIEISIATDIDNGQMNSVKGQSEEWFTIDGQKLNGKPTKKGVYINNGQQVVIK